MYSVRDNQLLGWVSPFGNPRIKVCCRLPEAYRRLPRPSSPSAAKASTECAYSLDHITQPAKVRVPDPMVERKSPVFTCDGAPRRRHASDGTVTLHTRRRTIFYFNFGLSIAFKQRPSHLARHREKRHLASSKNELLMSVSWGPGEYPRPIEPTSKRRTRYSLGCWLFRFDGLAPLVEPRRIELLTSCVQDRCSPS